MALYLAEEALAQGPDWLDEDAFATALGEAFSCWLDDPLMPSTAPGNTCIAGVRNWHRSLVSKMVRAWLEFHPGAPCRGTVEVSVADTWAEAH